MIRILNIIAIAALIGSAIYAYSIKYQTIFHAEEMARLNANIKKEQDETGMLRAEWANLIRPERVQALSEKLTGLQPLALNQIVKADAIPDRAPKVDSIGRKLEDLGLSAPTNTPADSTSSGATPVSTGSSR